MASSESKPNVFSRVLHAPVNIIQSPSNFFKLRKQRQDVNRETSAAMGRSRARAEIEAEGATTPMAAPLGDDTFFVHVFVVDQSTSDVLNSDFVHAVFSAPRIGDAVLNDLALTDIREVPPLSKRVTQDSLRASQARALLKEHEPQRICFWTALDFLGDDKHAELAPAWNSLQNTLLIGAGDGFFSNLKSKFSSKKKNKPQDEIEQQVSAKEKAEGGGARKNVTEVVGEAAKFGGAGATAGGILGSVVPGVGNAVGLVAGGATGVVTGAITSAEDRVLVHKSEKRDKHNQALLSAEEQAAYEKEKAKHASTTYHDVLDAKIPNPSEQETQSVAMSLDRGTEIVPEDVAERRIREYEEGYRIVLESTVATYEPVMSLSPRGNIVVQVPKAADYTLSIYPAYWIRHPETREAIRMPRAMFLSLQVPAMRQFMFLEDDPEYDSGYRLGRFKVDRRAPFIDLLDHALYVNIKADSQE